MNIATNILSRLGLLGLAKGGTVAAQATVTTVDADHNALDVAIQGTPALPADAATQTTLAAVLASFTNALARFGVLGADGATIASLTNALPIFGGLLSHHSSATIPATGVQIKASPGAAYSINYKNDTGFTRYIQIHNTIGQPGAGNRSIWSSAAVATGSGATLQIGHTVHGGSCNTAVYLVLSSTIFSYSAVADTAVQVELLYK